MQRPDGHFVFELEADATIPAEYVLLRHYLAEPVDSVLEAKIAVYLRRIQGEHGGWPLFHDGDFDMSASVKAYFALKMIGDPVDAAHMVRAREAIRSRGGAARSNVFTRFMLALFGFVSWRAVPVMPVEIMLLPKWFPFHLDKISYWSRTVIVPLLVLQALKPGRATQRGEDRRALPGGAVHRRPRSEGTATEGVMVLVVPRRRWRVARDRSALSAAVAEARDRACGGMGHRAPQRRGWSRRDLPGHGEQRDDVRRARLCAGSPDRAIARRSVDKLLVVHGHEAYCQPCVSPIWDTALACHTLLEVGGDRAVAQARKGLDWRRPGRSWMSTATGLPGAPVCVPGAGHSNMPIRTIRTSTIPRWWRWPWTGRRAGQTNFRPSIARAREWIVGMQSRNGGWGAFDADNEYYYLNNIPFADHGALLDPPTEDVTARCVSMLAQIGDTDSEGRARADYLRAPRWRTAAGTADGA